MKIRKINKTHIVTAMVLSAAFLFAGCRTDTTGEVQTEPAPIEEEISNNKDLVQENDFYTNLRDSNTYDSSFGKDIGLEIRTRKQNVFYTFYDIDGNETLELIIAGGENGVLNPAFSPWNYDLYGYDGTNVVHIFPEMEFGYR